MGAFRAKGLALKETNVGEADRMVTLLLKGHGKLSVSARGARKVKSKYLAAARPFCYCDYTVYSGGSFNTLASADVIENFYGIGEDYGKLCAGAYLLELTEKTVMENLPCDDILYLLLVSLKVLEKGAHPPDLVRAVFELKFLQLCGYEPELDVCAECGAGLGAGSNAYFGAYGTVCARCRAVSPSVSVSAGFIKAAGHILTREMKNLFLFSMDEKIAAELDAAVKVFFDAHSDARVKSGKFVK